MHHVFIYLMEKATFLLNKETHERREIEGILYQVLHKAL